MVRDDVTKEVKHFLNGGPMPNVLNGTIVVLIPKVQHLEKLKDMRSINLCNVVYKIASKVFLKLFCPILFHRTKVHLSSDV